MSDCHLNSYGIDARLDSMIAELRAITSGVSRLVAAIPPEKCSKGFVDAPKCGLPPLPWYCTRDAGHEGPCAAKVDGKIAAVAPIGSDKNPQMGNYTDFVALSKEPRRVKVNEELSIPIDPAGLPSLSYVVDKMLNQMVCACGGSKHHGLNYMPEGSGEGESVARLLIHKYAEAYADAKYAGKGHK